MLFVGEARGHVVFLLSSGNFSFLCYCLISLPSAPSVLMSPSGHYYATVNRVSFYWWASLKKHSWTFKVMELFLQPLLLFSGS